jgi:hypothetical protein
MPAIEFNADEVEPRSGFDPLPPGKYKAVITESEEKQTKKGDGSYMQFTFEVIDGDHKGRKLWARLNLNNPNDQAVGIARSELSAICRAVNVKQLKDTQQLHDLPMVIKVSAKKDDQGEVRNEIKGYEPAGGVVAGVANKPAAKPAQAPWKKQSA